MGRRAYITPGRLIELPPEDLKSEWTRRFGTPAPALSPDLLRLGIGYKLQEQKLVGLSRIASVGEGIQTEYQTKLPGASRGDLASLAHGQNDAAPKPAALRHSVQAARPEAKV